jgi:hypothetical protein
MAPVTMRRSRVDDDDDLSLYDPEWLARGKKVVRDGGVVRTSIMLMDGAPNSRALNDAVSHRPHQIVASDSAETRAALADAEAAYQARSFALENAWRGPATPVLPPLGEDEDARADYIRRLGEAWKSPGGRAGLGPGNNPPGNPFVTAPRYGGDMVSTVQAALVRRTSPGGARPGDEPEAIAAAQRRRGGALPRGVSMGPGAATDAANDPDAAYDQMCARLRDAWKT